MKHQRRKPWAEKYQTATTVGVALLLIAGLVYLFGVVMPSAPVASSPSSHQEKQP